MMALGGFRFALDTAAYQQFSRSQVYRWPSQERLREVPALQFVGPGTEAIELNGIIYPHFRGGLNQIEKLREIAGNGEPLLLTDGLGFVLGQWAVTQIREGQSFFHANGQPMKQSFQITLVRYGGELDGTIPN